MKISSHLSLLLKETKGFLTMYRLIKTNGVGDSKVGEAASDA
jgi:hypothetical protein